MNKNLNFMFLAILAIFAFGCEYREYVGTLNHVCNEDATCDYPTLKCVPKEIKQFDVSITEYFCVPKQTTETSIP